eukprot:TRINITY_DN45091_c0_g1_i1.p2 TRINITY_DN45091_c0_g1~~TRINITY_DN45091_c0_g1_i1.p2  ORF type:complete len:346 (+),score=53.36 TRINITY_DN45091_c0_g1_i1:3-1040(+)
MGLAGVAWATVLLQGVGAIYMLLKARRTGLLKTNRGRNLIPRPTLYAEIARQGFPAALNSMTIALGFFVIFRFVSDFGPEAAAAYGIATRIDQIVLLPTIGLSVAALTITAQNFGAGRIDRIRENMKKNLLYGAFLLLPLSVPIFLLAEPLMRIFTDDPTVVGIGAEYLRIDAFTLYGYVVIFISTSILQGIKRPLFALWLGVSRQVAAPYILFSLFTRTLGYPIAALWFSILGIVWVSAGIAFWFARRTLKNVGTKAQQRVVTVPRPMRPQAGQMTSDTPSLPSSGQPCESRQPDLTPTPHTTMVSNFTTGQQLSWQSHRLITGRSQVRILAGPPTIPSSGGRV